LKYTTSKSADILVLFSFVESNSIGLYFYFIIFIFI
jgi:hypothetical protein